MSSHPTNCLIRSTMTCRLKTNWHSEKTIGWMNYCSTNLQRLSTSWSLPGSKKMIRKGCCCSIPNRSTIGWKRSPNRLTIDSMMNR